MPIIPLMLTRGGAALSIDVRAPVGYPKAIRLIWALIDTGADQSIIQVAKLTAIGAPLIGAVQVARPGGGTAWADTYEVRLKIGPNIYPMEVIGLDPADPKVEMLFGMDLLIQMGMTWDGPSGTASLTV